MTITGEPWLAHEQQHDLNLSISLAVLPPSIMFARGASQGMGPSSINNCPRQSSKQGSSSVVYLKPCLATISLFFLHTITLNQQSHALYNPFFSILNIH